MNSCTDHMMPRNIWSSYAVHHSTNNNGHFKNSCSPIIYFLLSLERCSTNCYNTVPVHHLAHVTCMAIIPFSYFFKSIAVIICNCIKNGIFAFPFLVPSVSLVNKYTVTAVVHANCQQLLFQSFHVCLPSMSVK